MSLVLLGFMGVGKTSVALCLNKPLYDMDKLIEKRIGMSIKEYFASQGEQAFRKVESQLLRELLELQEDCIISTGGGVVLTEENKRLLRANQAQNILLTASFETIYQRIMQDNDSQRPLFLQSTKEEFYALYQKRMKLYEDLVSRVISTENKTPQEIARIIECM